MQAGETDAFKWVTEAEFIDFVNSGRMIDMQFDRWQKWFAEQGYLK